MQPSSRLNKSAPGWRSAALRLLLLTAIGCGHSVESPVTSTTTAPAATPSPGGAQLLLSPSNPQIAHGTGQQFTLRAMAADGRVRDVTPQVRWTVATADGRTLATPADGLVELGQPGRYVVTAEFDGGRVQTPIIATAAAIRSVTVTPSAPKVAKGLTQQFKATATMTDGTTQDVTSMSSWSVKDTTGSGVAVVNSVGLVTAKNVGKARISARYMLNSGSTTVEVTAAAVKTLQIAPQDVTIAKGTSRSFAATGTFTDGTVQDVTALADWAVMDVMGSGVASIDGTGTAFGEAVGQAKVSAEYLGVLAETTLTVSPAAVVSLTVAPLAPSIVKGTTQKFTATARLTDGSSQDVSGTASWVALDIVGSGVASIDASGLAKGNGVGLSNIGCAYRGFTATTTLEVKPAVLTGVALSPATASVAKGRTQAFRLIATYSDGAMVDVTASALFTASDVMGTDVASVAAGGVALGKNVGQAQIRGDHGGKSATATLTVGPAVVTGVAVLPSGASIAIGATQAFRAQTIATDGATADVTAMTTWSIADVAPATGVATLSTSGVATGKAKGMATVTAQFGTFRAQATLAVGMPRGVCSVGGWCWRNPLPQGNYVPAVWAADANNVWAVSDFGVIVKWNGSSWLPQASGTTQNLLGVWGSDVNNVWAVGVGGVIVKWNGSTWSPQTSGTTQSLSGVWGSDANNVWAVGSGGVIVKWNGTAWTAQTSGTSSYLRGIWGTGASNVWAVGQAGAILRFDGTAWAVQTSGTISYLRGVWGTDANNVWTVGLSGTILKWDGTAWTAQASGSAVYLRGVWGSSASNVFAVGDNGTFLRFDGTAWAAVTTGTSVTLNGLWGVDASNVWLVGNSGLILKWNGAGLTAQSSGSLTTQVGVWGSDANNIWIVGEAGQILKWNGTGLTAQSSGTTQPLLSAWGSDARNVWVVGGGGTILYWNGTAWTPQTSPTTMTLVSVWGSAPNRIYAVGTAGAIVQWDGSSWTQMTSPTTNNLYGVWGSDANNVWAVGYGGTLLHYDGMAWTAAVSGTVNSLSAVWGSDASNVWAVGGLGTILRYSPGGWLAQTSGTSQSLYGVWGSSTGNVWAVGAGGAMVRWNGTTWATYSSGSSQNLNALWGSSASNVWAVGAQGSILQYAP